MGKLSTHVLDLASGCPAAGMSLELWRLEGGERSLVLGAVTNADGRTDGPLLSGGAMRAARYELVFAVASYFRLRGLRLDDPPFLEEVPLRFAIADVNASYHVPLLCTPWSFSTYKGS
jgi:5-hydroxyisourate hydrolase